MTDPLPGTQAWLDQVSEPIIDPDRTIVDPHHHLWERASWTYLLEDLRKDTASGHRVEKTVFVECGANYHDSGPEHLRCVGETEFVTEIAAASAVRTRDEGGAQIAGIVARADLTLGDSVEEVLDAHRRVAGNLFKGIRHAGAHARNADQLTIAGRAPEGLYAREDFRRGLKRLGDLGYSYDTWHYHYQNPEYAALARAVPDTVMVLDHFGTPLGVGSYSDQREEIFAQWQNDITEIAACPNVVAKLGGLAMPDNGFGWHTAERPPDSKTFADAQRRYYLHTIEAFGPDRCMFESNFPVDRMSISYQVLWNGLKRIAAEFSDAEQNAMFAGTAARVYRLS